MEGIDLAVGIVQCNFITVEIRRLPKRAIHFMSVPALTALGATERSLLPE